MRCARSATCRGPRSSLRWLAMLALVACGCDRADAVVQPLQFSHKRHTEAEVDCLTCHEKAADGPAATLPPLRVCTKCHKEIQGKDPEPEQAIFAAVKSKKPIEWVQVNRMPGHVYFSHRAHVGFAEMKCETCHGEMTKLEHSLTVSNVEHLTMSKCISCHEASGANNECITCHK